MVVNLYFLTCYTTNSRNMYINVYKLGAKLSKLQQHVALQYFHIQVMFLLIASHENEVLDEDKRTVQFSLVTAK